MVGLAVALIVKGNLNMKSWPYGEGLKNLMTIVVKEVTMGGELGQMLSRIS